MEKELLIYSDNNNRTNYLFETILPSIFNVKCTIIQEFESFTAASGFKINYSDQAHVEGVHFQPSGLLNESKISPNYPQVVWHEEIPRMFINDSKFGFDPFSAMFFMLSRYEEYIHPNRDGHGRFEAKNSIAYNNGFLKLPIVELWLKSAFEYVQEFYSDFQFEYVGEFKTIPTFDLDNAYAYRGKGFVRNLGGVVRDGINLRFKLIGRRIAVLSSLRNDPYDTYEYIRSQCENLEPIFFIPVGRRAKYDKNLPSNHVKLKQIVDRLLQDESLIGIHPSYKSNRSELIVKDEIQKLSILIDKPVQHSRQHYLKLTLPETYSRLINNGVKHDYTMGYADQIGFRAGIARPFKFFNLKTNLATDLVVHPFAYMDGTFHDYLKYSSERAVEEVVKLKKTVKSCSGEFSFIWHNDSLREGDDWKGWRQVFEISLTDD